jgi:hypothetical protein
MLGFEVPTETPTEFPTEIPTEIPTETPTETPYETPTEIAVYTDTPSQCSIRVDDVVGAEGADITIRIEPTDAILREIKVTAKPKQRDFTNAVKAAGGSTEMSFEYFPEENRAVAKNALWYGYGQGDTLCMKKVFAGDQGKYELNVTATFDDGCVADTTATLEVLYPSDSGSVQDIYSGGAKFDISRLSAFQDGESWVVCVHYRCPGDNCIVQDSEILERHPPHLQYYKKVMEEEAYHIQQGKGGVDWARGGNMWNGLKVASSSGFIKHFLRDKVCAGSTTSEEAALVKAIDIAERHLHSVWDYFINYIERWNRTNDFRCWVEYTAKNFIGFDKSYGGFHYACTYMKSHSCPATPNQPDFFWKWVETQPKPWIPLPKE